MKKSKKYFLISIILFLAAVIILVITNRSLVDRVFTKKCEMKKVSYALETDCVYLYSKGEKIENSNYQSFKNLEVPYHYSHSSPETETLFFVDKSNIYITTSGNDLNMSPESLLVRPNDLHAPSLEFLEYMYAKDKNHVYYNFDIIERADTKTFMVETGKLPSNATYMAKDKNLYFWRGSIVY